MATLATNEIDFGKKLAAALGLDANVFPIRGITIQCEVRSAVVAKVEMFVTQEQAEAIEKVILENREAVMVKVKGLSDQA